MVSKISLIRLKYVICIYMFREQEVFVNEMLRAELFEGVLY